jgi:hypothetical protein
MFWSSFDQWHNRFGHPPSTVVAKIISSFNLLVFYTSNKHSVCNACQQAKCHQLPYSISQSKSHFPLNLVFSNVWGPASTSTGGYKYYVSFIDDYNKFSWIYLLKFKSQVFPVFREFQKVVEKIFSRKIITIQTDWGGEYNKLHSFFKEVGL